MAKWFTEPSFWYQGTKANIGATTITIHYEASMSLDSSNDESNAQYEWYIYTSDKNGNVINSYSSTSSSGSITLKVNAGYKNAINAKLRASYEVEKETAIPGIVDTEIKYLYGNRTTQALVPFNTRRHQYLQQSGTYTLYAYTKNNESASSLWGNIKGLNEVGNASSASYIDGNFKNTAANWLAQWKIWRSWYDQQDRSTTTSWNNVSLIPTSPITAAWYNACAAACGGSYQNRNSGQDIQAIYFRDISTKVTTF